MSFQNRIVHGYSEIKMTSDEYAMILKQYGFITGESAKTTNSLPNSLPEKAEQYHDVLREVESGRESAHVGGHLDLRSPTEREIYEGCVESLSEDEFPEE